MKTKYFTIGLIFCLLSIGVNLVAQNTQRYDITINRNERRTIDFSGVNSVSGVPEYKRNNDLFDAINRTGSNSAKKAEENQDIYYSAYKQLIDLEVRNQCQKDIKEKLLKEFKVNVKDKFDKAGWQWADVRGTIMDEITRINKEISDKYDVPCGSLTETRKPTESLISRFLNLIDDGKYEEASSLYDKNKSSLKYEANHQARLMLGMAELYYDAGRKERAITTLKKARLIFELGSDRNEIDECNKLLHAWK